MMRFEEEFGLAAHAGYAGMFTRRQAPGAIPNGSRVRKRNTTSGDGGIRDRSPGTVHGSITASDTILYFIEWDEMPKMVVGVPAQKVGRDQS